MALLSFMARLGLDATGFEKNLARADSQVTRFGDKTLGELKKKLASAFTYGAIAYNLEQAIEKASKLNDQAARLGVSTKFFQEWAFGLQQAGASSEDLVGFLEKLAVARTKALQGGPTEGNAFAQFGIGLKELQSGSLEGIASKISKAFEGGNPQQFVESLRALGGRGAGGLISAFSDGMDDSAKKAQELGLVLSDETIQSLDELGDRFDIIKNQFNVGFSKIGEWGVKAWGAALNAAEKYFAAAIQFGVGFRQGNGIKDSLRRAVDASITAVEETGKSQDEEEATFRALQERKRKAKLAPPDLSGIKNLAQREVQASQFQSSSDRTVASLGGYYLGGDASARNDLARQALELSKRTADDVRKTAERLQSIDAKIPEPE